MRGSYIGSTAASQAAEAGSTPVPRSKKEATFVYQKLLLFLSKPQAWHIITRKRVYHRRRRISSAEGCINCGLMRYSGFATDDIQN